MLLVTPAVRVSYKEASFSPTKKATQTRGADGERKHPTQIVVPTLCNRECDFLAHLSRRLTGELIGWP